MRKVAIAYESFGFDLFVQLVNGAGGGNIAFSPLSIAIALAMTYNGAKSPTSQALAEVLGIQSMSLAQMNDANRTLLRKLEKQDDNVWLTLANSLWTRKGHTLDSDFVQRLKTAYAGEVGEFDPSTEGVAKPINRWISTQTQGKIKALVSDNMLKSAIVVLLNAIYFKGDWAEPFKPHRTKERDFTLANGTIQRHPMMSRTGRYRYFEGDLFQAICLPYADERTSMYIFLPHESVSLQSFCIQLTAENWQAWLMNFTTKEVSLKLPRFKLSYDCQLKEILSAMGLSNVFSSEANFKAMGAGNLTISNVIHKAVIEVNEEGAEAAAATAVMMVRSMPHQLTMEVNRPFCYMIRDDSLGVALFMGLVTDLSL